MKKFLYLLFVSASILLAVMYLLACLTPVFSPADWWPFAFLELGFPYLALAVVTTTVAWFWIKRKVAIVGVLMLLMGYKNIAATLAFNPASQPAGKQKSSISILLWNVRGFDNPSTFLDGPGALRRKMFNYVKKVNADVLCLQEFNEHQGEGMFSNTAELVKMGYKYYYRTNDIQRRFPYGLIIGCSAIFSRLPLTDTGKVLLGDPSFPEHIGYGNVQLDGKPVRIFTAHFKSFNFHAKMVDSIDVVSFHGDKQFLYKASALEKIKAMSVDHAGQARIARSIMDKSEIPYLFAGDLNSVPTSYVYHHMSRGLQDAFRERGNGLGTSLDGLPVTLRIDYLLLDKRLSINRYLLDTVRLSDHYPQQVEISWAN